MEDLYFENELKRRKLEDAKTVSDRIIVHFSDSDAMSFTTEQIYQNFDDILEAYLRRKFGNTKDYNEIWNMIEEFKSQLTDKNLFEMYKKINFTEEELAYIKLTELSGKWRDEKNILANANHAVIDILLRRKIIEYFGESSFVEFRNIINEEFGKLSEYTKTVKHYMQLLSDEPYGKDVTGKLEERIEEYANNLFNNQINCGGYALKIDECVYPSYQMDFSSSVSLLLNKFEFIRLLGDEPLKDDEYIVIYRAPKGKNDRHHFVRIDEDGIVREKDGYEEKRIFKNWGDLEDAPEAVFAVKKDHKMFGYNLQSDKKDVEGLNFEQSVSKAIEERSNTFLYHGHTFHLKKTPQEDIVIVSDSGIIVADAVSVDEEVIVEVRKGQDGYVENFMGTIKPIIKDGRLINFNNFKVNGRSKDDIEI